MGRGDFYQVPEPRQRCTVADEDGWFPVYFHENQVFGSVHTASFDAVADVIPSEMITPLRLPGGRALVGITAFRYGIVTWTAADGAALQTRPFGEVAVAVMVSWKGNGPGLSRKQRLRGFVLEQPVTAWRPCEDGWELFGFPKFVADMAFTESTRARAVQVDEGGQHVLTLEVRPGGPATSFDQDTLTYTSMNGELIANAGRWLGQRRVRLGRNIGRLHLGDHPVADRLRRLEIATNAIGVIDFLDHRSSINELGHSVGRADEYHRYPGQKRPVGRYTLTYPALGSVDLNDAWEKAHP